VKTREPAPAPRGRAPTAAAAQRRLWVFYNARGQVVGTLHNGWLVKRVDSRRHQLRKPPGWCVDEQHIEQIEALGARGVKLLDEHGRTWTASTDAFRHHGLTVDRGHGRQVLLVERYWRVELSDARQLGLFDAEVVS